MPLSHRCGGWGGELRRKGRLELAGGEIVEGEEAGGEFFGGQAAVAVESTQKVGGGARAFLRIAVHAAGDEVAVGITPGLDLRDDMVEALYTRVRAAQAIKTEAGLAGVDGPSQRLGVQEIRLFQVEGGNLRSGFAGCGRIGTGNGDLFRQAHFDDMTGLAAFDQAQDAVIDEATHGRADGAGAKASATGEPVHRKVELELAFEAGVAEEMEIDDLVGDGETQSRDEDVRELFPDEYGVGDFGFHGSILREK